MVSETEVTSTPGAAYFTKDGRSQVSADAAYEKQILERIVELALKPLACQKKEEQPQDIDIGSKSLKKEEQSLDVDIGSKPIKDFF